MEFPSDIPYGFAAGTGYQRKIKTPEELKELIGARPRKKTVIMCHGTFDIVHPGHVRHMMYAKSKADILVASLTCDAHITKANFRPYIPEQLRAMNLAALEMVDYVIIDQSSTPIENLKILQPDFYAKGYEYNAEGMHPKTREENAVIESYGGEIIFTPGDVVFSSSAFIEQNPPKISVDKLLALMTSENLTYAQLRETLAKLQGVPVHVVGDTIVDSYTYGSVIGGMTKTPTQSVRYERQVDYAGGAAVVSKHLRAAGAKVKFTTVLGDDALKDFVLKDLEAADVQVEAIIDKTRPTTQKNAIIANGYRLLKVDKVDNRAISERILEKFTQSIQKSGQSVDAFIFSDFRHGIFSKTTIGSLVEALPEGPIRVCDSQVASRWGNILDFQGFDLITPNEREARFALGDQDSVVRPLALDLFKKSNCKYLILKMGEKGALGYRSIGDDPRAFFSVDSFAERVLDPVGAGDALLAYSTLALIASKNIVIATILGSMAAAVACEHDGNRPVTPEEVLKLIDHAENKTHYR